MHHIVTGENEAMKSRLTALLFALFALGACTLSTDDLAEEVKANMKEKLPAGVAIRSLVLTKKQGNEYSGVLSTSEPSGEMTYSVEVVYDGDNMTWKIIE